MFAVLMASVWTATAAFAQASPPAATGTVPAANQVLLASPAQIEVAPQGRATSGTAKVLNADGKTVAAGRLAPLGDGRLSLRLPALSQGIYLVSWSAGDSGGSFGFDVAGAATSPAVVTQPKTTAPLGPLQDNLVQWAPLILIMIFVGTLGLRFLVSAPVSRRIDSSETLIRTDRRLVQIAAVAIALFVPTTLASFAYTGPGGTWDWGAIWPSLGADIGGHIIGGRLAVTALAAVFVIPLAFRRSRPPVSVLLAGLACGMAELVGREVPSSAKGDWPRSIFNTVAYSFHLFGAAIWIGGLVALVGLAVLRAIPSEAHREYWSAAIRRFSLVAEAAVGVLILSGLWLYWVHIEGFHQLYTTLYGRTLLVKLILVAVLVMIGAANQFWLMPLIDSRIATGDHRAVTRTLVRHFRATIAVEAALGLAVLFVAPLLAGSARNEAFQSSPAVLGQTATSGSTRVELIPSGETPGLIDYEVHLSGGTTPQQVSLAFASSQLGVAPQRVTATEIGDGTYRVSGLYTPVVGDWQVSVQLDDAAPAAFVVPITAVAPDSPKAPAPDVRWTTWLAGIGETVLVVLVMLGSFRISRRLTAARIRLDGSSPTPEPEPGLVGV
jgi:putative copper export protein/methionine-rich copper-binding protein CopC